MKEPCETLTVAALGELFIGEEVEDEMEDRVEDVIVVYQCVDVIYVTTVLSLLMKTRTAVLVDTIPDCDVVVITVDPSTKVLMAEEEDDDDGEAEYVNEVAKVDAGSVLEIGALVGDNVDPIDPLDEVDEVEAAAQATLRTTCTPLLAQVEPNVVAAARHCLVTKRLI